MKIVEIISSFKSRGGAEVFLSSLCCQFKHNNDIDLYVISLYDLIDDSFKSCFTSNGIEVLTCSKKNGFDVRASKKLRKIINDINPDIIHIHLTCLVSYFMAFRFKKTKWKLVETFHSIPGKDADFITSFLRKQYIKRNQIFFVGISDKITNVSREIYKSIKCKTIFNGIDLPKTIERTKKEFDFIIVASLTPVKNHMLLFKSFKTIVSKYNNASLLCVGGGPLFEEYCSFIKKENLGKNILMVGPKENVYPYLEQSYYFVLSSLREGNPISILEAMSFGLPIIAPNVGGIPDIVVNNVNGFLFDVGDEKKLTDIMLFCLQNKSSNLSIKKNNIERVKQYSIELCSNKYYDFFNHLLTNKEI